MTAPFERSFAGPFIGEDAASLSNTNAATKWVTWANVTFQKNLGLIWSNGDAAYAGDCEDLSDAGNFVEMGANAKCHRMKQWNFCTADGNYGPGWATKDFPADFASEKGRNSGGSRMDEACCVCGGGREVAVSWMRDLGEVRKYFIYFLNLNKPKIRNIDFTPLPLIITLFLFFWRRCIPTIATLDWRDHMAGVVQFQTFTGTLFQREAGTMATLQKIFRHALTAHPTIGISR